MIDQRTIRQTERYIGNPQHSLQSQLFFHTTDGLKRRCGVFLFRRYGKGQAVDINIPLWNTERHGSVHDPLCNFHSLFNGLWYPVFIKCQTDYSSPVLLNQRQNSRHRLLFSVHGIYDSLSAIYPQRCFDDRRISGINLQRRIGNSLQLFYYVYYNILLVNTRNSCVDIENFRSIPNLISRLIQNIIHIAVFQRFFQLFLSRRIYPLTDNPRLIDDHRLLRSTYGRRNFRRLPAVGLSAERFAQSADKIRPGSAAAADQLYAQRNQIRSKTGKFLRLNQILSGSRIGKSCVGLGNDRQSGPLAELFHQGLELGGTQGAVYSHGIGAQSFCCQRHGPNFRSGKGSLIFFKAHGADHGQISVFFGRKKGRFQLIKIRHRLDGDDIGAFSGRNLSLENLVSLFKGKISVRLKQSAYRTDIQRYFGIRTADGFSGVFYRRADQLLRRIAAVSQLIFVYTERAGTDNVCTCFHVFPLHILYNFRLGDIQYFRNRSQIHTLFLQHGSHSSIQKDKLSVGKKI